ncbi:MAG: hypothetical protein MH825_01300 [Cyanobacteria bacterium]|nr:hypothetical protein [Cyanobacteriota bacterium]
MNAINAIRQNGWRAIAGGRSGEAAHRVGRATVALLSSIAAIAPALALGRP